MSFRIEAKIPLTLSDLFLLQENLLSQDMKTLFPKRVIRSVYFDNNAYQMFHESEEGSLPRKKIRIRNYPEENTERYSLEIKISSIEGRYKTIKKLDKTSFDKLMHYGYFDNMYGHTKPVAIVQYEREYFTFKDRRITFDTNISYISTNNQKVVLDKNCVLEVKTSFEDNLDEISKFLPIPLKRFSKYSNAILSLKHK